MNGLEIAIVLGRPARRNITHHIRRPGGQQWAAGTAITSAAGGGCGRGELLRDGGRPGTRGALARQRASDCACLRSRLGLGVLPRLAARRKRMHRECRDRCAQGGNRRGVAREKLEQVVEKLRIALLDVADDLLDLTRGRKGRILQRHRNFRPARVSSVLGERAATHDRQRERPHGGKQPAQHPRALPERETVEACGDDDRKRGGVSPSATSRFRSRHFVAPRLAWMDSGSFPCAISLV